MTARTEPSSFPGGAAVTAQEAHTSVTVYGTPTDGQVPVWSTERGRFEWGDFLAADAAVLVGTADSAAFFGATPVAAADRASLDPSTATAAQITTALIALGLIIDGS